MAVAGASVGSRGDVMEVPGLAQACSRLRRYGDRVTAADETLVSHALDRADARADARAMAADDALVLEAPLSGRFTVGGRLNTGALRAWLWEMARFLAVGGLSFVVDLGLFNLLIYGPGHVLGHKPLTAKIVSVTLATLVSWIGNRYWTFAEHKTARGGREQLVYGAINVVGALVPVGTLAFSRYTLGLAGPLADNVSTVLGIAAATVIRYVGYKRWVFTGSTIVAAESTISETV